MEGARFLETFDYPVPMASRGSRDVTNVPAQALTLLNDPFVIAEAEACARRLLASPVASVDARIEQLFLQYLDGIQVPSSRSVSADWHPSWAACTKCRERTRCKVCRCGRTLRIRFST